MEHFEDKNDNNTTPAEEAARMEIEKLRADLERSTQVNDSLLNRNENLERRANETRTAFAGFLVEVLDQHFDYCSADDVECLIEEHDSNIESQIQDYLDYHCDYQDDCDVRSIVEDETAHLVDSDQVQEAIQDAVGDITNVRNIEARIQAIEAKLSDVAAILE